MGVIEVLIIIGVAIGLIIIGYMGAGYIRKKGGLKEEGVDFVNQVFLLAKIITIKSIDDEKSVERINKIFDSIQDTFNYIYLMTTGLSEEDQQRIAKEEILRKLTLFNIEVDEGDILIIDFLIQNFLRLLPETE